MIIPQKADVIKELSEVNDAKLKKDVLELYEHLLGTKTVENAKDKIEDVLRRMFKNQYSKDVYIPLEFCINSSVAKVLFNILYADEVLYSTLELMELSITKDYPNGYTRQYISQEVKNGRLSAIKKGGSLFFTEREVNRYLIGKGIGFMKRDKN